VLIAVMDMQAGGPVLASGACSAAFPPSAGATGAMTTASAPQDPLATLRTLRFDHGPAQS
jgi:hypothetical protein